MATDCNWFLLLLQFIVAIILVFCQKIESGIDIMIRLALDQLFGRLLQAWISYRISREWQKIVIESFIILITSLWSVM